ncbi:MAG: alcohol dehydrogenase catalytic domain-containing protein [Thermodesulfobacteriota bacterium]
MRALHIEKGAVHYSEEYPAPRPKDDEALIRVLVAGICNTDLEIIKGYMGFHGIPGHEFVGIIEECGERDLIGKRIIGEINTGCGSCDYCLGGMKNHCPRRSVLGILNKDGAFADHLTLPASNLHPIPDSIKDEEAIFVEPLAAACEVLEQVAVGADERVCVLGDGKLGLLVGQVLAATGCNLVVAGRHREKLAILKERGIGTTTGSDFNKEEFDVVVDCTGSSSGLETALRIVEPRGKVVLKTTVAERGKVDLNQVVINEISIIGSRCGPFPPAIDALENGSVDVRPLISTTFPLEEGLDALSHASQKGVLKVILKMV